MKKSILIILILICSLVYLTNCGGKDGKQSVISASSSKSTSSQAAPTTQTERLKVSDYFPFEKSVRYIYEGSGNEYASFNVYNDYNNENRLQQRVNNGGTEAVSVFEIKAGKLLRVLSRGEVYYRENFLDKAEGDPEIVLMEPLVAGNSWTLTDSRKRTITDTAAEVNTPMGSYKAIEVTTETSEGKNVEYYAKDIGLIKTKYISGDLEVTSVLKTIEKDVSLITSVQFFYPVKGSEKLHYVTKDIAFKTNDITKQKLAEAYKSIAESKLDNPLTTDIQINSLYLNNDKSVYIDLNTAFITEINKNTAYERPILQSIANTFGSYYNSQNVVLTIEGELYKSDTMTMKKGQTFKVNTEGSIQD